MATNGTDVTVIGCGLMGSALARQFAKSGYRVAAWNRTHERAETLAGDGITPMQSVVAAVRSSPLVVACTLDYGSTRSALEPIGDWDGTTLVNVATGAPDEAEELERWVTERGGEYLDGSIFGLPGDVGSAEVLIVYSGQPDIWSKHQQTLAVLGGASRHVAEEIRTANVLTVAFGAFYFPALGGFVEALTYGLDERAPVPLLLEVVTRALNEIPTRIEQGATAITSGHHETDQAAIETWAEGGRAFVSVMREAGHHARLLAASVENIEAAEAAGLGKLGFFSQTKVVRRNPDAGFDSITE